MSKWNQVKYIFERKYMVNEALNSLWSPINNMPQVISLLHGTNQYNKSSNSSAL